jgi:transposase
MNASCAASCSAASIASRALTRSLGERLRMLLGHRLAVAPTGHVEGDFLKHLGHKLLVVRDGAPIHYGQVKSFLAEGAAADIHLERLPAYAPELNPVEGMWRYLKHVELANVCCADLDELWYELRKAVARLRHKPDVIEGCVRQPGCY